MCLAGIYQEGWSDFIRCAAFARRVGILPDAKAGELGLSLSIIAEFFNKPWRELVPGLDLNTRLWLLGEAGFTLTILRRLSDAIEPLEAAVKGYKEAEGWENASLCSNNLSELYLHLGRIPQAINSARSAVSLADRSGVTLCRMGCRATLGHALYQAGRFEEAKVEFETGENIQSEAEPERPCLYGQPLFQYCDLLLDQGMQDDVIHRIERSRKFSHALLLGAMDLLAVGRALKPGTEESAQALDNAVSAFRRSEQLDQLPLALLARASDYRVRRKFESSAKDLIEVQKLTERPGMLLHLADVNIEFTRLLLDQGKLIKAQFHFVESKRIVNQTGYNRRMRDISDLKSQFH